MYDWHTKWAFWLKDSSSKIYEIDKSIMGVITDSPDCIAMLYRAGVLGWYIRPPSSIPHDMTIHYIIAPGWEKMPTAHGRRSSECDPREFTDKDYPGMPFPTVLTACPRSGDYVVACQSWRKGHLGPTNAQVVVTEAPSGPATVESFPSTGLNLAKFKELELDYVPPQSPAWKKVLAGVDTNSWHIISNPVGNKLRGYQFPDPFLFITGANHRSLILAWLMMQAQWLQTIINVDTAPQLPAPQHWRNCLYDFAKEMCLLPPLPSMSKVAHGGTDPNIEGPQPDRFGPVLIGPQCEKDRSRPVATGLLL
ncbi:uncharacterized protein LACBIDRAFT_332756 [Laccaria bicolor S238N-H82]|uniref:Predicted protein n=1 Tax=Laccaria bicolor (strain S238N-H82 / ATCC MYA-4686) TaxID=486041 RepID=B0DTZ6_LACBS|nr:uncharacterized protein LACBIDRAFT_332756 [Laccaria bicolor S238N-H82]EDR01936.1 predicted protein [Laccaria bicolor S238N-H82]|eukprot:XP_001887327.1 predicted protein [Laccaria bicolor S238N-H82]